MGVKTYKEGVLVWGNVEECSGLLDSGLADLTELLAEVVGGSAKDVEKNHQGGFRGGQAGRIMN